MAKTKSKIPATLHFLLTALLSVLPDHSFLSLLADHCFVSVLAGHSRVSTSLASDRRATTKVGLQRQVAGAETERSARPGNMCKRKRLGGYFLGSEERNDDWWRF